MQKLRWDDIQILLALGRRKTMGAAAQALAIDHSTISRRLSALEAALGAALVERTPQGVLLTEAGTRAFAHALKIEDQVNSLAEDELTGRNMAGAVRIACPEAFGNHILAPHIAAILTQYPDIEVQLVPQGRRANLINREADIWVGLARPEQDRLIARKLGQYRLGLYAAAAYLDRHDGVATPEDLQGHRFVSYIEELLDMPQLSMLAEISPEAAVSFRSTSVVSQAEAVAQGAGIGLLHVFAAHKDERLVRVLPQFEPSRDYWLAFREDARSIARVRVMIDWILELCEAHLPG